MASMSEKLEIIIECDYNDGDYITEITTISKEDLDKLRPLFAAIKANHGRYEIGEYADESPTEMYPQFTEDMHDLLQDFVPWGEHGFHTIESVKVAPLVEKEVLV
jgi:hypothetical protein